MFGGGGHAALGPNALGEAGGAVVHAGVHGGKGLGQAGGVEPLLGDRVRAGAELGDSAGPVGLVAVIGGDDSRGAGAQRGRGGT